MPNLVNKKTGESFCWADCETMRKCLERYSITDTGPVDDKNMYIINDNATSAKMRKVMTNIRKRLLAEPHKNFLIVYVFAGHGMNACGKQVLLLNEYNKKSGFYKMFGAEAEIRDIAEKHSNSY